MPPYYNMTSDELRAVQLTQLELLREVDRICRKRNINYRIVAGTLLGAVRHKGFIPWDDDADVAFLREEYEQFRTACESELDTERFYFQDHRNTPGYRWGYGKLRRKGTEFIRLNQEHMPYEQGIFIDIFPYDCVPDFYPARLFHALRCFIYRKIFWAPVGKINAKGISKLMYITVGKIPAERVYNSYQRFVIKSNKRESNWVRILTYPTPTRDFGYKREWAYDIAGFDFEGTRLRGVAAYDEYLTFKYGDYMTLPPEGERKTHPVSRLKLTTSDIRRISQIIYNVNK